MASSIPPGADSAEELFAGSRMKLVRARQFIDELEDWFRDFASSAVATAGWVIKDGQPMIRIDYKGVGLKPGAIVGDAIHNLRTALDLMASEMARIAGRPDGKVYFPFADSKDRLDDRVKTKNFDECGADAVEVLRQLEPYHGGNNKLRALHDLDIQDKHRALIVLAETKRFEIGTSYAVDGTNFGDIQGRVTLTFTFPEGSAFAGRDVVETLKEMVEMVDGIIETFARLVRGRAIHLGPNP